MESHGVPGQIHVSEATAKLLRQQARGQVLVPRGRIPIKGKGEMATYFYNPKNVAAMVRRKLQERQSAQQQQQQQQTQEDAALMLPTINDDTERSAAMSEKAVECAP